MAPRISGRRGENRLDLRPHFQEQHWKPWSRTGLRGNRLLLALLSPPWRAHTWPFCQGLTSQHLSCWLAAKLTPGWELQLDDCCCPLCFYPCLQTGCLPHSLISHPTSEIKFHIRASEPAAKDPGELSFLAFYLGEAGLPGQRFPRHSKSDQRRWAAWKCKQCLFQ